jgi:hypothetical protein
LTCGFALLTATKRVAGAVHTSILALRVSSAVL